MKEAAGEANLTVVAIILIGVVVAVATPLVNSLMHNARYRSCCTDAGGVMNGSKCSLGDNELEDCMGTSKKDSKKDSNNNG